MLDVRKGVTASNPTYLTDAIEAIKASSKESSVYIGCDSQRTKQRRKGSYYIKYSVVIIVHKDSCRGGRIFPCHYLTKDYNTGRDSSGPSMKMRLLTEVQMATEAATAIVDHLDGRHMEVHLDINPDPKHASSVAVREALGWSRGMGFVTKIKPDGWAATHAADHVVRNFH